VATTAVLLLAVDAHRIAGIVVLVAGIALALFGAWRIVQRLSGAALVVAAGLAIAVIGILVYTHTFHA
jgi:uncharacterized membrane protein